MIGSFLTRGLVMIFGYAYPAYECYKTVEKNKPEIEHLRFWCQYWILVAVLTVCERIGDAFISWVPMYSEAKLAFIIYLWYPKTKGTTYVYDSFFKPYVAKHENEIDRSLLELRTRAGDMFILYWQRAASYGQTRVFDILQYVASQSTTPRPRAAQPQQGTRTRQPANAPTRQPSTTSNCQPAVQQPETEEPPSPTSSTSSSRHQAEVNEEVIPAQAREAAPPAAALIGPKAPTAPSNAQKTNASETSSQPSSSKAEAMEIEAEPSKNENANPPPKDTNMDEAIRRTSARLRKSRSAPKT
ncbi:hypothetical protein JCGZ_08227 [Jatropha curcas]|uniref:HVA22-like protein n=1 Tax=Jatropha curcas TaxID=180498 RepID=A0A067KL08_JATCU|nr:putative HVA22-like protein g [Jatropha curcas]KDP36936.1 hypothetical protein JCGZ_08227 [Jatropha curcas]